MPVNFVYTIGTISVTTGGTSVTGVGTQWATLVYGGDVIIAGGAVGVISEDPASHTSLTLAAPWTGPTLTGAAYTIILFSPRHTWPSDVWARVRTATQAAQNVSAGTTVPSDAAGIENDLYLKLNGTTIESIYRRGVASWVSMALPAGPVGADGPAGPPMRQNLLINGDFQINQRQFAGGALASGAYGFDRWKAIGSGVSVSRSGYTVTLTTVSHGSDYLIQVIEPSVFGFGSLAGQQLTISVENPSADLRVFVGSVSGTITAGSGRRSVTLTVSAGDTGNLTIYLDRPSSAGSVSFSHARVEVGATASAWTARSASEELALCQRYFYVRRPIGSFSVIVMITFYSPTEAWGGTLYFPTTMRSAPTVTVSSPSHFRTYVTAERNVSAITGAAADVHGIWFTGGITITGGTQTAGQTALLYFANDAAAFIAASAEL